MPIDQVIIKVSKPFNQYGISLDLPGPKCKICKNPIIVTDEMSESEKNERIKKLEDKLREHGYLYVEEDVQYFLPARKMDDGNWIHEYCLEDDDDDEF